MTAKTPAGRRAKGHNYERMMANWLSTNTGFKWYRGLEQTRIGGSLKVSDVMCDELPQFYFELKKQKKCNIKAALEQTLKNCGKKAPVIITKDDYKDTLVTMRLEDWIVLFNHHLATLPRA